MSSPPTLGRNGHIFQKVDSAAPLPTYTKYCNTREEENNIFSSHLISSRKGTQLAFGRDEDPDKVNVNEMPNVDALTLTALGFGAIAFNFFVLANAGDGGIGGIVARLINTFQ